MKTMISLSRDEIQKMLPYAIICQTRYGARWCSAARKRRWMAEFTEKERTAASTIFSKAESMYLKKGVPDDITMSTATFQLWLKIGNFCASL